MEMKTKEVIKKFNWVDCPYCEKHMESEYVTQLNYNYKTHVAQCKDNPKNMEEEK